jgi:type IV pilus assembly protein PilE
VNRQKGFTLMEVVIAAAIIGLLAAIAYPSYKDMIVRGNRTAVQGDLEAAAAAMAAYRSQNFTYTGATLGTGAVYRNVSPESGPVQYDLVLTVNSAQQYVIFAQPRSSGQQKDDGALGINQAGERCWNKSSSSSCTPGDAGQKW